MAASEAVCDWSHHHEPFCLPEARSGEFPRPVGGKKKATRGGGMPLMRFVRSLACSGSQAHRMLFISSVRIRSETVVKMRDRGPVHPWRCGLLFLMSESQPPRCRMHCTEWHMYVMLRNGRSPFAAGSCKDRPVPGDCTVRRASVITVPRAYAPDAGAWNSFISTPIPNRPVPMV
jgi:hypothetical protein